MEKSKNYSQKQHPIPKKRRKKNLLASRGMQEAIREARGAIGWRVKILWPAQQPPTWYKGTIKDYDAVSDEHCILYDDGDVRSHNLADESFHWLENLKKPAKVKVVAKPQPEPQPEPKPKAKPKAKRPRAPAASPATDWAAEESNSDGEDVPVLDRLDAIDAALKGSKDVPAWASRSAAAVTAWRASRAP